MSKNIERKDAQKNWDNTLKRIALQKVFGTFEEYWKESEKFNLLNENEKHDYLIQATKILKRIKTDNSLRRIGIIKK